MSVGEFERTRAALRIQIAAEPGIDADSITLTLSTNAVGARRVLLQVVVRGVVVMVSFTGTIQVSLEGIVRLQKGAVLERDGVVLSTVEAAREQYEERGILADLSDVHGSTPWWPVVLSFAVTTLLLGGGVWWCGMKPASAAPHNDAFATGAGSKMYTYSTVGSDYHMCHCDPAATPHACREAYISQHANLYRDTI